MGDSLRAIAMIVGVVLAAAGAILFGQSLTGANELSPWAGVALMSFGILAFLASLFARKDARRRRHAREFDGDLGELEVGDLNLPDD